MSEASKQFQVPSLLTDAPRMESYVHYPRYKAGNCNLCGSDKEIELSKMPPMESILLLLDIPIACCTNLA